MNKSKHFENIILIEICARNEMIITIYIVEVIAILNGCFITSEFSWAFEWMVVRPPRSGNRNNIHEREK